MSKRRRVHYYSNTDGSVGPSLKIAKEVLTSLEPHHKLDINDCIELFHIKQLFENSLYLPNWNENEINQYKSTLQQYWPSTKLFFRDINPHNIYSRIEELESGYSGSFWQLINYFQTFKHIDGAAITSILSERPYLIREILQNERLVKHYYLEIKSFLLSYKDAAELILRDTEEVNSSCHHYFPKSLTLEDKESIIANYVKSEDPNLNYLLLIVQSRNSKHLKLSPRIRLDAKRKERAITESLLEKNSMSIGVSVALDQEQTKPEEISSKNQILSLSYSKQHLDKIIDHTELFDQFYRLFRLVDYQGVISLVSKDNEVIDLERLGLTSKNSYPSSVTFRRKEMLSFAQITMFEKYLKERNLSIELLASEYITNHLSQSFKTPPFKVVFPSNTLKPIEKIRTLVPELEFLLRQYRHYVIDGQVDFELLELDSSPLNFSEVPSLLNTKYIYPNTGDNNPFKRLQFYLCSNESWLNHTTSNKRKYSNFYELITNEELTKADFLLFQNDIIEQLIQDKHLCISTRGYIKLSNPVMISIINTYQQHEHLSYWHFTEEERHEIDRMIETGWLTADDKLFTRQETSYLNYFLNQKEFTNGHDLRNKYLHGTNTSSDKENEQDYMILLRLIILVILKVKFDLSISEQVYVYQFKKQHNLS